ncbi:hypothetical protein CFPU101_34600 [Chroococcus sp. FPU101]|nr:hypothetical protein CFPU101_34600 [Chroococcus sp. FPU101]
MSGNIVVAKKVDAPKTFIKGTLNKVVKKSCPKRSKVNTIIQNPISGVAF